MARILLMEDDVDYASMLAEILEVDAHKTKICASASEAWEELQSTRYDLLITDIYVKKDGAFTADGGVTLLGRVRSPRNMTDPATAWLSDLPVLAITGGQAIPGGFDPLIQARDMGANELMRKPVGMDELRQVVDDLLQV